MTGTDCAVCVFGRCHGSSFFCGLTTGGLTTGGGEMETANETENETASETENESESESESNDEDYGSHASGGVGRDCGNAGYYPLLP